ncbi:MAG: von Willebrand factor type A domain-containing protein [Cyclobacteriaceae bacterium]|nr:von Willebrand factor type A domain-containing protein [Cyclobacteriaceae bacterium HetDA_MAG_MS6]
MKAILSLILISMMQLEIQNSRFVTGTVYDDTGATLPGVTVTIKGSSKGTVTDVNGFYSIEVPTHKNAVLSFAYIGFITKEVTLKDQKIVDVTLQSDVSELQEVIVTGYGKRGPFKSRRKMSQTGAVSRAISPSADMAYYELEEDLIGNTEDYATIHENGFRKVTDKPLSTFSIDVDAASYSNMRRFINHGQLPPKDAVRIEEMINYFSYNYRSPEGDDPFSINTEVSRAPWNEKHLITQIGLQGKRLKTDNLPSSNLVFLIDVSGSMQSPNKLPLLKASLKMLTNELRPQDKVSIVVYAGAAGMVLPPTDGNDKKAILSALDKLTAGGSTAGGAGIKLAYKIAKEQLVEGGNNRIVLATDGDFNVGASSNAAMERLVEEKRKEGVFLTVLGYGMGNYKDSKMEILADKGNGNYAYIDNIREAKKVLVNEFGGTLFTIAKDVKIQVEFNPQHVQAYRLIGYENRKLKDEDFNNDRKDAGELGSGHTVTALYEIIPVGVKSQFTKSIDPLKYQENLALSSDTFTDELLTIKFRYKHPDRNTSKLIEQVVSNKVGYEMSENLSWSAAVAGFGMLLRDSEFKSELNYGKVLTLAKEAKGKDIHGYRQEFIDLVEVTKALKTN